MYGHLNVILDLEIIQNRRFFHLARAQDPVVGWAAAGQPATRAPDVTTPSLTVGNQRLRHVIQGQPGLSMSSMTLTTLFYSDRNSTIVDL